MQSSLPIVAYLLAASTSIGIEKISKAIVDVIFSPENNPNGPYFRMMRNVVINIIGGFYTPIAIRTEDMLTILGG